MLNKDPVQYQWATLLSAYAGKNLNVQQQAIWHEEIIGMVGNMTDAEICECIRGWQVPKNRRGTNCDVQLVCSRIREMRAKESKSSKDKKKAALQRLFAKIRSLEGNPSEIWEVICKPKDPHYCRILEKYAVKTVGFNRLQVKEEVAQCRREIAGAMLGCHPDHPESVFCSGTEGILKSAGTEGMDRF